MWLAVLLSSGCTGPVSIDDDRDGAPAGEDCDDHAADVHPGAIERCDGVDQNCDGQVDEDAEGAPVWHPDADGDGFGVAVEGVAACVAPGGYVSTLGDCDDADPTVSPGQTEHCNGHDDDCDGRSDNDAIDAPEWYRDEDGDGWGTKSAIRACVEPEAYSDRPGDCDDGDDDVFPDAVEVCDPADVDEDCDGSAEDPDAEGQRPWYADADGDGFGDAADPGVVACDAPADHVDIGGDCDDTEAAAHPGGVEWCNGLDDDCDGETDRDALDHATWWADADGDGFGDPAAPVEACGAPANTVDNATDCDDTTAAASPTQTETCDGIDNDCDTTIDESGADAAIWYLDGDADGYGDPSAPLEACDAPPLHVADASDCDDTDASVNPVGVERCNGADDDCNGSTDGTDAEDVLIWYADSDGDTFGDPGVSEHACTAPAGFLAVASDCDDTRADIHPDAQELCDGMRVDEDCDALSDDADPDAIGQATWYPDGDGDGYGDAADLGTLACLAPVGSTIDDQDCDDTDAAVSPAGVERCDGVDDDCDGVTDPSDSVDAPSWYLDADADGYGDVAHVALACTLPAGHEDDADDCDDADASVHPDAGEVCNHVDDDCDGVTDEDALDAPLFYADVDGDGYGGPTVLATCERPAGYTETNDDCDDGDALVSPDGAEVCDPADVDEDCDGVADDADSSATGQLTQWSDVDGDGYGAGDPELLCDLQLGFALLTEDCDDADVAIHPNAGEICDNLVDDDCDDDRDGCGWGSGVLDDADLVFTNTTANDYFGGVVAGGDLDADGYADLLVTAYGYDGSVSNAGRASIWFGPLGAETLATADATLTGSGSSDRLGFSAALLDDADVNGLTEVLVGGDGHDDTSTNIGAAWIFEPSGSDALSMDSVATFSGATSGDALGYSVAGGDLDGDGVMDVVCGAPGGDGAGVDAGALFAWIGPFSGEYDGNQADEIRDGAAAGDEAGTTLTTADLDGDGTSEVVVGAPYAGASAGGVFIYTYAGGFTNVADGAVLTGVASGDQLGMSVANVGDHDGDGLTDLLVGADLADDGPTSAAGAVWLVLGDSAGLADATISDIDAAVFVGVSTNDRAGGGAAGGGDVDGDGADDLLIGATRADGVATDAGAVYLVYGPASGRVELDSADVTWSGPHVGAYAGGALSILGDVDLDGRDDIGVGVKGVDDGTSNSAGAAYVLFGTGW